MTSSTYSVDVQRLFLQFIIQEADLYLRVSNIFKPENFDRSLIKAAEFIKQHTEQYSALPDRSQVQAVTGTILQEIPDLDEAHHEWFLDEFEKFTRRQEVERAVLKCADLLEKGEYDPCESIIKDAVQISLTRDMGTDYFADPRARLLRIRDHKGQISTGWANLDYKLYGGFDKGALNIFAGCSGAGKSLILQNLACNWILAGLTGVYITLELSEDMCSMRIDSMLSGVASRDVMKSLDDVELKVKMIGKKAGKLHIKYMKPTSTVNDIRAYIKQLQIKTGVKIDFMCIDYLDLLLPVTIKVDPSNLFIKDKYVSEELRFLGKELDVLNATASQLGRCLTLDTLVVRDGQQVRLDQLNEGDVVSSPSGLKTVVEILPPVKQHVWEIITKSGRKIKVSSKHNFPTVAGLKSLETGLVIGDKLSSSRELQ